MVDRKKVARWRQRPNGQWMPPLHELRIGTRVLIVAQGGRYGWYWYTIQLAIRYNSLDDGKRFLCAADARRDADAWFKTHGKDLVNGQ